MTIVIEKNIKLPSRKLNGRYPFAEMVVGDSFFVPGQKTIALMKAQNAYGIKLKAKQVAGGVRVWRTA